MVIVAGPQPTSSRSSSGLRCGRRYAAEFSAVLQVWDLRTDEWWPETYEAIFADLALIDAK